MKMSIEELREEIYYLFNPEPDDEGFMPREFPHSKLKESTELDFSFLETLDWEGSSCHEHTRYCPEDEEKVHTLTRNKDVPGKLFEAALHIFADSIIAYYTSETRAGQIRFYPSIILTFWSGFETYIRYTSELMIAIAKDIPVEVINFLKERESYLDKSGEVKYKSRYQAPLDRYAILLKYGYKFDVDRGNKYWQNLEKAKKLRDYYTHLNVNDPRSITTTEVINFLESILLSIIWPSSVLKRTIFLGVYHLHGILIELSKLSREYLEQPLLKDWPSHVGYLFHCNFVNVDIQRFPNTRERK